MTARKSTKNKPLRIGLHDSQRSPSKVKGFASMSKTKRDGSHKSTDFRQLTSTLIGETQFREGECRSACSCASPPIVGPKTTSWQCPKGMPWECLRQHELFPVSLGDAAPERELPPTCNTGVARPESTHQEQKAIGFCRPTKGGSK
jgi:hypothetical protein